MFYELFVELRSVHIFTIYSSVHDIVLFCIHFVVLRNFRSSMKF